MRPIAHLLLPVCVPLGQIVLNPLGTYYGQVYSHV